MKNLPESLREMAALIGIEPTMRIVERYGGTELYIPHRATLAPHHPLALLVGYDHAVALAERFGDIHPYSIPRCSAAIRAERNARIAAEWAAGASQAKLAWKHGLTSRQVRNILRAMGAGVAPLTGKHFRLT